MITAPRINTIEIKNFYEDFNDTVLKLIKFDKSRINYFIDLSAKLLSNPHVV